MSKMSTSSVSPKQLDIMERPTEIMSLKLIMQFSAFHLNFVPLKRGHCPLD